MSKCCVCQIDDPGIYESDLTLGKVTMCTPCAFELLCTLRDISYEDLRKECSDDYGDPDIKLNQEQLEYLAIEWMLGGDDMEDKYREVINIAKGIEQ
jgi:hypothetical protein